MSGGGLCPPPAYRGQKRQVAGCPPPPFSTKATLSAQHPLSCLCCLFGTGDWQSRCGLGFGEAIMGGKPRRPSAVTVTVSPGPAAVVSKQFLGAEALDRACPGHQRVRPAGQRGTDWMDLVLSTPSPAWGPHAVSLMGPGGPNGSAHFGWSPRSPGQHLNTSRQRACPQNACGRGALCVRVSLHSMF